MKGPGCIQAHTVSSCRHETPKNWFCEIDSPSEEERGDKSSIERSDLTQRHVSVAYTTI